jgi:hypothetical protein
MSKYDDNNDWELEPIVVSTFNALFQSPEYLYEIPENFILMLTHMAKRAYREGYNKALQHYEPIVLDSSQFIRQEGN